MALFLGCHAYAGNVRTVEANGSKMIPIYLRMGRSTVLRFQEKPKKVVLGNSNYYGIEFTDKDIAVQPRGAVATNLFVYSAKHTYGFLLRPSSERYDDLVHVYWEDKNSSDPMKPAILVSPIHVVSNPHVAFRVGHLLGVKVDRIEQFRGRSFYLIDLTVRNISTNAVSLSGLQVDLSYHSNRLPLQEFVVQSGIVQHGQSARVRLLFTRKQRTNLTLKLRFMNTFAERSIPWRYF